MFIFNERNLYVGFQLDFYCRFRCNFIASLLYPLWFVCQTYPKEE